MAGRARVSQTPQFKGESNKGRVNIAIADVDVPSYQFSTKDQQRIENAREEGILIPETLMAVTRWAKVLYPVACTLVHKESYKGQNWWGSDPTWMRGVDLKAVMLNSTQSLREVTEATYKVYRLHVDLEGDKYQAQGVGPAQLTSFGFQSRGDWFGGCWKPEKNLMAALGWWREQQDAGLPTHEIATRYNGSSEYGDDFVELLSHWQEVIN